jgi:hypothetical protein
MPLVFSARDSEVRVGNDLIEGVRAVEYRSIRDRREVTAIGSDERIAVYYGARSVTGRLRVASTSAVLDGLLTTPAGSGGRHLAAAETSAPSPDECWLECKQVDLADLAATVRPSTTSATRVREEDSKA